MVISEICACEAVWRHRATLLGHYPGKSALRRAKRRQQPCILQAAVGHIVRQDDPPRVTLIDFKSGDDKEDAKKLDAAEMALQIGIYAIAARSELEYEPEQGMVRYLDSGPTEKAELKVPLDANSLEKAKNTVAASALEIRQRKFSEGPRVEREGKKRCVTCDFLGLCGMSDAIKHKKESGV